MRQTLRLAFIRRSSDVEASSMFNGWDRPASIYRRQLARAGFPNASASALPLKSMFATKHKVALEKHFEISFLVVSYGLSFVNAAAKHMVGTLSC